MRRSAPPLQCIEAFLVAAKSSSFRAGAEKLALSPSAFSRRIQALETFVGAVLFDRWAAAPTLTDAGRTYRDDIEAAMETISAATFRFRCGNSGSPLRIMASQSFAISWLMPRMPILHAAHPELRMEVILGRDLSELRRGAADLAVAYGPRDFDGLPFEHLIELDGAIVAAPVMAGGRPPPRCAVELQERRLLGVQIPRDLVTRFLNRAGIAHGQHEPPILFETLSLMYEAAANGLGIAVAIPTVADRYLQDGRLSPCLNLRVPLDASYNLVFASDAIRRQPNVRTFLRWMKWEVEASQTAFNTFTNTRHSLPLA